MSLPQPVAPRQGPGAMGGSGQTQESWEAEGAPKASEHFQSNWNALHSVVKTTGRNLPQVTSIPHYLTPLCAVTADTAEWGLGPILGST